MDRLSLKTKAERVNIPVGEYELSYDVLLLTIVPTRFRHSSSQHWHSAFKSQTELEIWIASKQEETLSLWWHSWAEVRVAQNDIKLLLTQINVQIWLLAEAYLKCLKKSKCVNITIYINVCSPRQNYLGQICIIGLWVNLHSNCQFWSAWLDLSWPLCIQWMNVSWIHAVCLYNCHSFAWYCSLCISNVLWILTLYHKVNQLIQFWMKDDFLLVWIRNKLQWSLLRSYTYGI